MSLDDANRCSVRDITQALAWYRKERELPLYIMRFMAYCSVSPYDTKKKIKSPAHLFPLPWEQSEKGEEISAEERRKIIEQLDQGHKRKHGEQ